MRYRLLTAATGLALVGLLAPSPALANPGPPSPVHQVSPPLPCRLTGLPFRFVVEPESRYDVVKIRYMGMSCQDSLYPGTLILKRWALIGGRWVPTKEDYYAGTDGPGVVVATSGGVVVSRCTTHGAVLRERYEYDIFSPNPPYPAWRAALIYWSNIQTCR